MSWHTPERKIEQALKGYFLALAGLEFDGVQIATRFSNIQRTEPRIEVVCDQCDAYGARGTFDPGLWKANVKIRVVSHYDPNVDGTAHDELCGQVVDKLLIAESSTESLSIEINNTLLESELEVIATERGNRRETVEDHSLVTEQEWSFLVACRNAATTT